MIDDDDEYHIGKAPVHGGENDRDKLTWLRAPLDDDLSLDQMQAEMYRRHFAGRAASSTVEALMYSLRGRGTAALKEAPVRHRLGQLSEQQLREVCGRLQRLKPKIAKAWTGDAIDRLLETWDALRER